MDVNGVDDEEDKQGTSAHDRSLFGRRRLIGRLGPEGAGQWMNDTRIGRTPYEDRTCAISNTASGSGVPTHVRFSHWLNLFLLVVRVIDPA
jgi:hypothetical protein